MADFVPNGISSGMGPDDTPSDAEHRLVESWLHVFHEHIVPADNLEDADKWVLAKMKRDLSSRVDLSKIHVFCVEADW